MTTYNLSGTNSDFSDGADFTKLLETTPGGSGSINVSVASLATENSYGYTGVGNPGTGGGSGSANYTVEVNVTGAQSDIDLGIFAARVNSSGTPQSGPTRVGSAEQNLGSAGVKTFGPTSIDLGTWNAGDRLRVTYQFISLNTMKTVSVTIETGTSNTEVIAGWAAGNNVTHIASGLTITGGAHVKTAGRAATATSATATGGTHTASKSKNIAHVAPELTAIGGVHLKTLGRAATAGTATATGGTHTASHGTRVVHVAAQATVTGGTHTASAVSFARPDADVTDGGWTNELGSATDLFESINEAVASDADYIRSSLSPSADACTIGLSNVTDPVSSDGHVVRYRYAKLDTSTTIDLTVRLKQGASTIASWTESDISTTPADAEHTLSGAQADAITDYTDLRLEFDASEV